jgi:FMN reductase
MNNMLTGFAPKPLAETMEAVSAADALIAVTPIFSTSYSGLFKSFVDVLDRDALDGTPVLLGATAGTPRHSLAIDYAIRPLFTYLHAEPVPTGVFAAADDWGHGADTVAPLQKRVDRGARELADAIAGRGARPDLSGDPVEGEQAAVRSGPAERRADPFHPDTYLGEGKDFTSLLNGLSR